MKLLIVTQEITENQGNKKKLETKPIPHLVWQPPSEKYNKNKVK